MVDSITQAPVQKPRHIASLDGLRALSVLLVILLHSMQRYSLTHPVPFAVQVIADGGLGVEIFFVISGYLITTLLLRELQKTGRISLKSFYVRRGFRILPPLYVNIAVIGILGLTGHLPGVNRAEILTALTFTRNYYPHSTLWVFEHYWSICIEEQFYLLWPGILVLCLRRRNLESGRKLAAKIALAVIVAEPFIRLFFHRELSNYAGMGSFHMQADSIMFGALGALLQGTSQFERVYRSFTRLPWLLPILLFLVSGPLMLKFGNYWNMPVGITINGALTLFWLLWLIRNPATRTGRIFNQPAVAWVGRLSYSLYIWQTLFLHHANISILGHTAWWNTLPGSWPCILVVALFSYYVIEQPSLRVRDIFLRKLHWHET